MPTVGGKQGGSTNGNGRHSNRRPAFTAEQATKLLNYDANEFYPISDKMTPEAVKRLENDRMVFKAWLALMLGTGLRPGKEHQAIRWRHFEQHQDRNGRDHLFLTIQKDTKTGARTVHVDDEVYGKYLTPYKVFPCRDDEMVITDSATGKPTYGTRFKPPDDFVFCDQDTGAPIQKFDRQFHTMLRNLKMEKDDNGDPFTPYSLRHTWATLKLNAGMDIFAEVREISALNSTFQSGEVEHVYRAASIYAGPHHLAGLLERAVGTFLTAATIHDKWDGSGPCRLNETLTLADLAATSVIPNRLFRKTALYDRMLSFRI